MSNYDFSDLKGKVVIIVGGFGLIGKAVSGGFLNAGSRLIIAEHTQNKRAMHDLKKIANQKITYIPFDITDDDAIDNLIDEVKEKYSKIDVFVNCSWPKTADWRSGVEKMPYSSAKTNLIDHLGGYFNCTEKVAHYMKVKKTGSIINFGSIYGVVAPTFSIYEGTKTLTPGVYAAIKGGIVTMTKYFAAYFGKWNVRVNCVSPGGVQDHHDKKFVDNYNRVVPLGRMANPNDIVGPVLFLASDMSSYITGHNLLVDGGWTAQ